MQASNRVNSKAQSLGVTGLAAVSGYGGHNLSTTKLALDNSPKTNDNIHKIGSMVFVENRDDDDAHATYFQNFEKNQTDFRNRMTVADKNMGGIYARQVKSDLKSHAMA